MIVSRGLVMLLLAAVGMVALAWNPWGEHQTTYSAQSLQAYVKAALPAAKVSGDGATVLVVPSADNGVTVSWWTHRPVVGSGLTTASDSFIAYNTSASASMGGTTLTPPFAILIASNGSATLASWGPGQGLLSSEPACSNPITVSFSGDFSESATIGCVDSSIN